MPTQAQLEALAAAIRRINPEITKEDFEIELTRTRKSMRVSTRDGSIIWRFCALGARLFACIGEAQQWRCYYCRVPMRKNGPNPATFEHIVPKVLGGADHPDNLALACVRCNQLHAPGSGFSRERAASIE